MKTHGDARDGADRDRAPGLVVLTPEQAAAHIQINVRTLGNWRCSGRGPRYIRAGRIRYRLRELDAWLEAHAFDPEAPPKTRRQRRR